MYPQIKLLMRVLMPLVFYYEPVSIRLFFLSKSDLCVSVFPMYLLMLIKKSCDYSMCSPQGIEGSISVIYLHIKHIKTAVNSVSKSMTLIYVLNG
jgi:hypothetical protein